MENKKLTVITWDAGYRENMYDGLECLKKQTVRDQIDFIHVEWGDTVNPQLDEYKFIKKYCLNLPFREKRPSFDTGLQWNFGLYAADTPWVSYCHLDIIGRDFYEKVLDEISRIENNKSNIIYLEGWFINQKNKKGWGCNPKKFERDKLPKLIKNYEKWKMRLGEDLDLLPYEYTPKSKPQINGLGITIKKQSLIDIYDGWVYNIANNSEFWNGPGLPLKKYGKKSLREMLGINEQIYTTHPDMVAFSIPHPKPDRFAFKEHLKWKNPIFKGSTKFYNEFIEEWLPIYEEKITLL